MSQKRCFCKILSPKKTIGLGWKSVPVMDVNGTETWNEVANRFRSNEYFNEKF